MTREDVVDKIRKLMAHAASALKIGSEQEAIAFAAKAQALMLEYGVSYEPKPEDAGPTHVLFWPRDHGIKQCRRCPQYQILLSEVVSRICLVTTFVAGGSNVVYFIGREECGRAACVTHAYLIKLAIAASAEVIAIERRTRRLRTVKTRRRFRSSFLFGFAMRLLANVVNARQDAAQEAMVRLTEIEREAAEYAARKFRVRVIGVHHRAPNSRAVLLGRLAADEVDLSGSRGLSPGIEE